jgi:hypothetical protein
MPTFSSPVPATEEWLEGEQEMLTSLITALDSGNTAWVAICLDCSATIWVGKCVNQDEN